MIALKLDLPILHRTARTAGVFEPRGELAQVVVLASGSSRPAITGPTPSPGHPLAACAVCCSGGIRFTSGTGGGQEHSDSSRPQREQVGGRSQRVPANRRATRTTPIGNADRSPVEAQVKGTALIAAGTILDEVEEDLSRSYGRALEVADQTSGTTPVVQVDPGESAAGPAPGAGCHGLVGSVGGELAQGVGFAPTAPGV